MRKIMLLMLGFLLTTAAPLGASAVEQGPVVSGTVASAKAVDPDKGNWELSVTLLEDPHRRGFGKGSAVPVTVKGPPGRTFQKGDAVKLRWQWYSGMTPRGPMTALSWHLVP
jgi:hypothetical protein